MISIVWDDYDFPHVTGGASDWHVHQCADGCGSFYACCQRDGCDHDKWTCPKCEWIERDAHAEALMVEAFLDAAKFPQLPQQVIDAARHTLPPDDEDAQDATPKETT